MADPQRRRVTLTLTLTDKEFALLACGNVVLDRIATLAVVAVTPVSPGTPVPGTLRDGAKSDFFSPGRLIHGLRFTPGQVLDGAIASLC